MGVLLICAYECISDAYADVMYICKYASMNDEDCDDDKLFGNE